jgi:hypothetical protein
VWSLLRQRFQPVGVPVTTVVDAPVEPTGAIEVAVDPRVA